MINRLGTHIKLVKDKVDTFAPNILQNILTFLIIYQHICIRTFCSRKNASNLCAEKGVGNTEQLFRKLFALRLCMCVSDGRTQ